MQGWKFHESNAPTRRVISKKNIFLTSNIDILITKNLNYNDTNVKYAEFDNEISDHKLITVSLTNLENIADSIGKTMRINKKHDYGTSRTLWTRLA